MGGCRLVQRQMPEIRVVVQDADQMQHAIPKQPLQSRRLHLIDVDCAKSRVLRSHINSLPLRIAPLSSGRLLTLPVSLRVSFSCGYVRR